MCYCSFVSQLHNALDVPIFHNADMLAWFEWLAMRFCSLNESFKMCLMVSYWVVWFTRNKVVHENIVPSVTDNVAFVRSFFVEHDSISTNERANSSFQPIVWKAPPVIAPLIHDIRIVARDFENISFSFARREANKVVHVIARDYRSQHVPCYWIEEVLTNATLTANLDRLKLVFT
ncbi:hypothetical protein V6N13_108125 [Hibiscus sabdariffa]